MSQNILKLIQHTNTKFQEKINVDIKTKNEIVKQFKNYNKLNDKQTTIILSLIMSAQQIDGTFISSLFKLKKSQWKQQYSDINKMISNLQNKKTFHYKLFQNIIKLIANYKCLENIPFILIYLYLKTNNDNNEFIDTMIAEYNIEKEYKKAKCFDEFNKLQTKLSNKIHTKRRDINKIRTKLSKKIQTKVTLKDIYQTDNYEFISPLPQTGLSVQHPDHNCIKRLVEFAEIRQNLSNYVSIWKSLKTINKNWPSVTTNLRLINSKFDYQWLLFDTIMAEQLSFRQENYYYEWKYDDNCHAWIFKKFINLSVDLIKKDLIKKDVSNKDLSKKDILRMFDYAQYNMEHYDNKDEDDDDDNDDDDDDDDDIAKVTSQASEITKLTNKQIAKHFEKTVKGLQTKPIQSLFKKSTYSDESLYLLDQSKPIQNIKNLNIIDFIQTNKINKSIIPTESEQLIDESLSQNVQHHDDDDDDDDQDEDKYDNDDQEKDDQDEDEQDDVKYNTLTDLIHIAKSFHCDKIIDLKNINTEKFYYQIINKNTQNNKLVLMLYDGQCKINAYLYSNNSTLRLINDSSIKKIHECYIVILKFCCKIISNIKHEIILFEYTVDDYDNIISNQPITINEPIFLNESPKPEQIDNIAYIALQAINENTKNLINNKDNSIIDLMIEHEKQIKSTNNLLYVSNIKSIKNRILYFKDSKYQNYPIQIYYSHTNVRTECTQFLKAIKEGELIQIKQYFVLKKNQLKQNIQKAIYVDFKHIIRQSKISYSMTSLINAHNNICDNTECITKGYNKIKMNSLNYMYHVNNCETHFTCKHQNETLDAILKCTLSLQPHDFCVHCTQPYDQSNICCNKANTNTFPKNTFKHESFINSSKSDYCALPEDIFLMISECFSIEMTQSNKLQIKKDIEILEKNILKYNEKYPSYKHFKSSHNNNSNNIKKYKKTQKQTLEELDENLDCIAINDFNQQNMHLATIREQFNINHWMKRNKWNYTQFFVNKRQQIQQKKFTKGWDATQHLCNLFYDYMDSTQHKHDAFFITIDKTKQQHVSFKKKYSYSKHFHKNTLQQLKKSNCDIINYKQYSYTCSLNLLLLQIHYLNKHDQQDDNDNQNDQHVLHFTTDESDKDDQQDENDQDNEVDEHDEHDDQDDEVDENDEHDHQDDEVDEHDEHDHQDDEDDQDDEKHWMNDLPNIVPFINNPQMHVFSVKNIWIFLNIILGVKSEEVRNNKIKKFLNNESDVYGTHIAFRALKISGLKSTRDNAASKICHEYVIPFILHVVTSNWMYMLKLLYFWRYYVYNGNHDQWTPNEFKQQLKTYFNGNNYVIFDKFPPYFFNMKRISRFNLDSFGIIAIIKSIILKIQGKVIATTKVLGSTTVHRLLIKQYISKNFVYMSLFATNLQRITKLKRCETIIKISTSIKDIIFCNVSKEVFGSNSIFNNQVITKIYANTSIFKINFNEYFKPANAVNFLQEINNNHQHMFVKCMQYINDNQQQLHQLEQNLIDSQNQANINYISAVSESTSMAFPLLLPTIISFFEEIIIKNKIQINKHFTQTITDLMINFNTYVNKHNLPILFYQQDEFQYFINVINPAKNVFNKIKRYEHSKKDAKPQIKLIGYTQHHIQKLSFRFYLHTKHKSNKKYKSNKKKRKKNDNWHQNQQHPRKRPRLS